MLILEHLTFSMALRTVDLEAAELLGRSADLSQRPPRNQAPKCWNRFPNREAVKSYSLGRQPLEMPIFPNREAVKSYSLGRQPQEMTIFPNREAVKSYSLGRQPREMTISPNREAVKSYSLGRQPQEMTIFPNRTTACPTTMVLCRQRVRRLHEGTRMFEDCTKVAKIAASLRVQSSLRRCNLGGFIERSRRLSGTQQSQNITTGVSPRHWLGMEVDRLLP